MKITTLLILLLSSTATADYPRDFVNDDALAVLSILDDDSINSMFETIQSKSKLGNSKPNFIDVFLGQYIDNPSAVDLSEEVLLILEPTKLAKGQRPSGMFGPMPHLVLICKAKDGRSIQMSDSINFKSSSIIDGWFIASGADKWVPKTSSALSPILSKLPETQVSFVANYGAMWKQFGPIVQMTGDMMIGGMNRPGPNGVISQQTRDATKTASKLFRELTTLCAKVDFVTFGIDFDKYILHSNIDIRMKEVNNIHNVDNVSMREMATLLSDSMIQYSMSGKLTKKLIAWDVESLKELFGPYLELGPSYFVTSGLNVLAELSSDNVVSYGLDKKNGLTISCLAEVSNQNDYLAAISIYLEEISDMLLDEYSLKLTRTKKPNTWDVSMIGSDEADQRVMNAVFPKDDLLRFVKQRDNRIAMALGPKSWKALKQSSPTPLSRVIQSAASTVDIDFALSFDMRKFAVGFTDIAAVANPDEDLSIKSSPSAKSSLLFGTTKNGIHIEIETDLLGSATLMAEMNREQSKAKKKRLEGKE